MPDSFKEIFRFRQSIRHSYAVLTKAGCLFLLFCILTGCTDQEQSGGKKSEPGALIPQSGGIYRIPLLNNPKSLDPARAEDQYSSAVVYQLFDGLVRFSPDLLTIPALAENWQIENDGTIYRFFLRKDAKFHNGRPITSRDVLFSFSRLIRTDPAPSILPHLLRIAGAREYRDGQSKELAGIQIINDRELLVRLEGAYAPFLAALGMHQTRILPEDEVSKRGNDFSRNPVGSGPFRFVSWEDDKSVRLERYSEYYLGAPLLKELNYTIYPGGQIEPVLADFQSRKLHEMPVYGNIRSRLLSQEGVTWIHKPSPSLLFYGMNCEHPLLRRASVRRALSMAIDREELVSRVYQGQFEPSRSLLPPGIMGYNPEHPGIMDDFTMAQQELDQIAPGARGEDLTLEVVSAIQSSIAKAELAFIAQRWERLGIDLKIKFIPDWTEFERYIKSPSMQIFRYAWFMDIPDPDNILQVLFGSDSNVNYMHYSNPEVDSMLQAARVTLGLAERAAIYRKIEDLVMQSMPVIPLVHLNVDQVYQSNVHGIQMNALSGHKALYQVWLSGEDSRQ
ncbi:MAG: ABC transporter substrate-binding protein [Syntrophobacteraceae bacterium]